MPILKLAQNLIKGKKMDNLEIFDKDGNALHIADVIYSFIKDNAERSSKNIEDVYVGVDVGFPKGTPIWVHTVESVANGYDAIDLNEFGNPIKVNCI
jgi:hypothetical protein